MSELIESLERFGYGWIEVTASLASVWRDTYHAWKRLFEEGELRPGDARKPEGYAPLSLVPCGELKQSYYCRRDTVIPHAARAVTYAAVQALCEVSISVSAEITAECEFGAALHPGRGCLRVMRYPPFVGSDEAQAIARLAAMGSVRAVAHADLNAITLLPPATAHGLEVETAGEWIPVPDRTGHILVQVGQELEARSAGRLRACRHRVRNPLVDELGVTRMAMALFVS